MPNLFDRQKFKSGLMSQGIKWTDDEIDAYLERASASVKPKSYLPYRQYEALASQEEKGVSLADPYRPYPEIDENAALDFLGNMLWEAVDVGTFGAVGALDYKDYVENILTTGGPGTFAGRAGAGIGGLAGFMVPFGITKGIAGAAVKGVSKYGTKAAGKKITQQASEIISNSSKYNKFGELEKAKVFEPFTKTLSKYGHQLENKAIREKFIEKTSDNVRHVLVEQLKKNNIKLAPNTINKLEGMIKGNMGLLKDSPMPIWNLQQRIAIALGGGRSAGKMATLASHVVEEAVIFSAVETPMEIMNSIDEHRDANIPGTIGHAMALGSALGFIRFIPGGKDMPIMRSAWKRISQMMNERRSYTSFDFSNPKAREQLGKTLRATWNQGGKDLFRKSLKKNDWKKLGTDSITSPKQITELVSTEEGARTLSKVMGQVEQNFLKKWWPGFMKEAATDLVGSSWRMAAGATAFNYEIIFDENIPLEDKVFNVLVGAYMTKRGRVLEYTNSAGERTVWEPSKRPWVYSEEFGQVDKFLNVLGMPAEDVLLNSFIKEVELTQKYFKPEDTDDVKEIMGVLQKAGVIVDSEEGKARPSKPADKNMHPVYSHLKALSTYYFHANTNKRILDVDEMTEKQVTTIENRLKTIDLSSTRKEGGIFNITDMDDVMLSATDKRTVQLIDLYKDVVVRLYDHLGIGDEGRLDPDNIIARLLRPSDINKGSEEFQQGILRLAAARDTLARYGHIRVSKDTANPMKMNVEEGSQAKFLEILQKFDSELHDLVFDKESVWDDFAPLIGDQHINKVLEHNSFFKGVRNSFDKLNDLENKNSTWKLDKVTDKDDSVRVLELINKVFTTEYNLKDSITVKDITTKDAQSLQEFVDNLLTGLLYSSEFKNPVGFATTKVKGDIANSDARELRNIFINNGLGGFAFTGHDGQVFMQEFVRHSLDRRLRSATRKDGTPFTGADRSKIDDLMRVGIISPQLEMINIERQIDVLTLMSETPELLRAMDEGKGPFPLNDKFIEANFKKVDQDTVQDVKEVYANINEISRLLGVTPTQVFRNHFSKYKEHIEPFVIDGKGNGVIGLSSIVAETDLATMMELAIRLDHIDRLSVHKTHQDLMETVNEMTHGGQTKEISDFLKFIQDKFWDRKSDTAELVAIMSRYNGKDEDGNLIPIYDKENRAFNFSYDGAMAQTQKIMRESEMIIPTALRSKFIDQRMRELVEEKLFESDSHLNVTPQSFIEKYGILYGKDKDNIVRLISDAKNPADMLSKMVTLRRKEDPNTNVPYEQFTANEKIEFMDDVFMLYGTSLEQRKIHRYSVGQRAGVWMDKDNTVYDNPLFRYLDGLIGISNYSIVDRKVETDVGKQDSRLNKDAFRIMINRLYVGGQALDAKLGLDVTGTTFETDKIEGQVFVNVGDFSWGLSIPESKLNDVIIRFNDFIKTKKEQYPRQYGKVFKRLSDILNIKSEKFVTKDSEGNDIEVLTFAKSDAKTDGEAIETMINSMWMDEMAGKIWWDHLNDTVGGKNPGAVGKFTKRFRLMANVSGKELSDEYVDKVWTAHDQARILDNRVLGALEVLRNNKGLNVVIPMDEMDTADMFSTLKHLKDQLNEELGNNAALLDKQDEVTQNNLFKPKSSATSISPTREDASSVDSVMLMPPNYFKALQVLAAATNRGSIGGIKPIISKVGEGVLLGKTAILSTDKFDGFFNANEKVHAIMMDSANKIAGAGVKKLDISGISIDQLRTGGIAQDDYINHIDWKSINIASIVAADHDATISYQAANELNLNLSNSMFKWMIEPSLKKFEKLSSELVDEHNTVVGTAYAKALDDPGTSSAESMSSYSYWIRANGPVQFSGVRQTFKNQVKKKTIDNGLLTLHNKNGSQSVMTPFIGGLGSTMRNTTFYIDPNGDRLVYTHGQASIAGVNRNKSVPLERLNIIVYNRDSTDNIITYDQLKNNAQFKIAVNGVIGRTTLPESPKLGKVAQILRDYSALVGKEHEVALVMHRPPRTRPNDMIIVGLKSFLEDGLGNQTVLNPFDAYARAEADYDIDKINYWWDTPSDVLHEWVGNAGKVGIVSPEPIATKTSLKARYDHLNASSMRELNNDTGKAQKLRGTVVKAQRIVQYLKEYSSEPDQKGFVLNLFGPYKEKIIDLSERIVFNTEKVDESLELLAQDIQRIIDSETGYNTDLYDAQWFDKFIFGDARYSGILKRQHREGRRWVDTLVSEDREKVLAVERDIVLETLRPYRGLLQLGTNLFENGEARSPRYDDLITHTRDYDSFMKNLNSRIYYRLRRRYVGKDDSLIELNKIFGVDPKVGELTARPLRDFGKHASTERSDKVKYANRKLPFERMLAAIAFKDRLAVDSPKQMFGPDYALYESTMRNLMRVGEDPDSIQEVYKKSIKSMQTDVKKLGFLRYLGWKINKSRTAHRRAIRENHTNYAQSISENLLEQQTLYKEVESQITSDPKVIDYVRSVAVKRIRSSILANPRRNKYKTFETGPNPRQQAVTWLNQNTKWLKSKAAEQPIEFKRIDSPEYMDLMIFNEIFGKFRSLFVDPDVKTGLRTVEFEESVSQFKRTYKNRWRELYDDKKRSTKWAPWLNENRIMNMGMADFNTAYNYWEGVQPGLGRLFLWKAMAPEPAVGTYSYFNGDIYEGFSNSSMSFVKFGLRYIANSENISQFEKTMFFDMIAGQYTDWYHALHSIRLGGKEGINQRSMLESTKQELYDSSNPLVDFSTDLKTSSMQAEWNPTMQSAFGYDNSYSYGYLRDISGVPMEKATATHSVFPRGYIPINYRGGKHPSITGWADFNKARRGDAYLMLGEALGKGIITHREFPAIKHTYTEIEGKPETSMDMHLKIDEKARSQDNSSGPEC
jgi:hypothetical protein|tara:strand:- start:3124 stop:11703 length:8580 start_codon:yes stop_codon:yes gene_type:complete